MRHRRGYLRVASAAALGIFVQSPLHAQQSEGGLSAVLTFGTLLNYEDDETTLRPELGLSFASQTRTQALTFDAGSAFDISNSDGDTFDPQNPYAAFGYVLERRDTLLEIGADYRQTDIEDLIVFDFLDDDTLIGDDLVLDPLVISDGERETLSTRLRLELGRTAPFGAIVSLAHVETNYLNVSAAGAQRPQDSVRDRASVQLRFRLNPVATAFTRASEDALDRDGGTDTTSNTLTAGLDLEVAPALTLSTELGQTRTVTDGVAGREVQDGLFVRADLALDRPNGAITTSILSDVGENGRRSTFRLARRLELPRGQLNAGLGFGLEEISDEIQPLYDIRYVHELPRGQISANLRQSFSTSTTGEDTLDSRILLGLRQELTELSSLSASLSLSETTQLAGDAADASQARLSIDYSRTLTEDWSLVGGITHIRQSGNERDERTEDRIFFGLRSSFGWRP